MHRLARPASRSEVAPYSCHTSSITSPLLRFSHGYDPTTLFSLLCVIGDLVEPKFPGRYFLSMYFSFFPSISRRFLFILFRLSIGTKGFTSVYWVQETPGIFSNVEYPGTQIGGYICMLGNGVSGTAALQSYTGGINGFV